MIKESLVSLNPLPGFSSFSLALLKGNLSTQHLQTPAQNKSRSNVFCVGRKTSSEKAAFFF
jgi:hypothetical protein